MQIRQIPLAIFLLAACETKAPETPQTTALPASEPSSVAQTVDAAAADAPPPCQPIESLDGMQERVKSSAAHVLGEETATQRAVSKPALGLFAVVGARGPQPAATRIAARIADDLTAKFGCAKRPETIESVLESINDAVHAEHQNRKLGASVAVVALTDDPGTVRIAHVGLARIHRLRGSTLEQLTLDQSLAEHLVISGEMKPDAIEPNHHLLPTSQVGSREGVKVAETTVAVEPGDLLVLHTDGVQRAADISLADLVRDLREGDQPPTLPYPAAISIVGF